MDMVLQMEQWANDKSKVPDVPELDDYIIPERRRTVIVPPEFNPLKRNVAVEKKASGSVNDYYILRYTNGKVRITEEEKENNGKLFELKQCITTTTTNKNETNNVAINGVACSDTNKMDTLVLVSAGLPSEQKDDSNKNNITKDNIHISATLRNNTSEWNKCHNVSALLQLPELDECITPEMNSAVIINSSKVNRLNRNMKVKEVMASVNDNYKNGNKRITKDKKENYRKSSELEQRNEKRSTTEANKFTVNELTNNGSAIIETVSEVATNEDASNEFVSKRVATESIVNISSSDVEIQVFDENEITRNRRYTNINNIDSSQQTEEPTSNFGRQKTYEEMDALLRKQDQSLSIFKVAMQEYEQCIKEHENEIAFHKNIIEEREKRIEERERMIGERDLMIKERDQKIKEYEDRIAMLEEKRYTAGRELAVLERNNASLVAKLNEKEIYCKENHREKPRPRKRKTEPQLTLNTDKSKSPNTTVTNNLNGFENEIIHSSPKQTRLVRNINEFTKNTPFSLQTATSAFDDTYCSSSSTLLHLSTNSANIKNTAISNQGQTTQAQGPKQIRVQGPNFEWTVELDSVQAVGHSSTLTHSLSSQPHNAASQNMNPTQSTESAVYNQLSHSSGGITSNSRNVLIPHHMIPRQPERTKSAVKARPNRMITIIQQKNN